MSGHSKWHNIQAKKGKADAARGKIFTKLGRELLIAVKEGGPDPAGNSKLKNVIAKCKAVNYNFYIMLYVLFKLNFFRKVINDSINAHS